MDASIQGFSSLRKEYGITTAKLRDFVQAPGSTTATLQGYPLTPEQQSKNEKSEAQQAEQIYLEARNIVQNMKPEQLRDFVRTKLQKYPHELAALDELAVRAGATND